MCLILVIGEVALCQLEAHATFFARLQGDLGESFQLLFRAHHLGGCSWT